MLMFDSDQLNPCNRFQPECQKWSCHSTSFEKKGFENDSNVFVKDINFLETTPEIILDV